MWMESFKVARNKYAIIRVLKMRCDVRLVNEINRVRGGDVKNVLDREAGIFFLFS